MAIKPVFWSRLYFIAEFKEILLVVKFNAETSRFRLTLLIVGTIMGAVKKKCY